MKSIMANQRQLYLYEDRNFFKILDELISLRVLSCVDYDIEYKPHELAVIHGDARPSNILKSKDKFVFMDFDYLCIEDFCFEIGSAAMLFSNYDISLAITFIETYLQVRQLSLTCYDVIIGTLNYYVQSGYPIKLIDNVLDHSTDEIAKRRINAISFCVEALNYINIKEKEC